MTSVNNDRLNRASEAYKPSELNIKGETLILFPISVTITLF